MLTKHIVKFFFGSFRDPFRDPFVTVGNLFVLVVANVEIYPWSVQMYADVLEIAKTLNAIRSDEGDDGDH